MKMSPRHLQAAAQEFRSAARQADTMVHRLDEQMRKLEESWEDVGKQTLMDHYREWHVYMGNVAQALATMADELEAVAGKVTDVMN